MGNHCRTDLITVERLRYLLRYDLDIGEFRWAISRRKCRIGDRAGTPTAGGYRFICLDGIRYYEHRLAVFYVTGEWPTEQVDHANRVRSENQWSNLRNATQTLNNANRPAKLHAVLKGVHRHYDGRWRVQIRANKKRYHLGCFSSPEEAHAAYCVAALKHFGEFARSE